MTVKVVPAVTMEYVKMVSILLHANVQLGLMETFVQVSNHSKNNFKNLLAWEIKTTSRTYLHGK